MRIVPVLMIAALLAACTPREDAVPAADATPSAAYDAFAGTWTGSSRLEGVTDPVASTLMITADGVGSTMTLEGRPDIATTLSMSGDSMVVQTAEYESVLRTGVMVSVRTAGVRDGDMLRGELVATYKTPAGDEIVKGTMESTRAPK